MVNLGSYFAIYREILKQLTVSGNEHNSKAPWKVALAGGTAGTMSWILNYPFDVVKTKIQSDSLERPQFRGIMDCFTKTVRQEGFKGLFRGISPCLLRAFPTNAVGFLAFEKAMEITK